MAIDMSLHAKDTAVATIEELLSEVVQARRETAIAKRDAEAEIAGEQARNEELVGIVQELRISVKQAQAEAVEQKTRAGAVSQEAALKTRNDELVQEAGRLKEALKQAQAESARNELTGQQAAARADVNEKAADRAQTALKSALADVEAERVESARLRARLTKIARVAEGKD
jgi:hypothetical protein